MRLLDVFADVFCNTFGITQPSDQTRRRAAWFITSMIVAILVAFSIGAAILFHMV